MSTPYPDLLGGPPPTLLPVEPEAQGLLDDGADPAEVAARHPRWSGGWAVLAERALAESGLGETGVAETAGRPTGLSATVAAYAYARTGYHRGLDALRRNGWKGHGPVPWSHDGNRGFLRALEALRRAAAAIGEDDEAERCAALLDDCDPAVRAELGS